MKRDGQRTEETIKVTKGIDKVSRVAGLGVGRVEALGSPGSTFAKALGGCCS